MKRLLFSIISLFALSASAQVGFGDAVKFNQDWLFQLGDDSLAVNPSFDDSKWRHLDLPHDWSVEGQASPTLASCTGYYPGGIAWYRKHFVLAANDPALGQALDDQVLPLSRGIEGVYLHCVISQAACLPISSDTVKSEVIVTPSKPCKVRL